MGILVHLRRLFCFALAAMPAVAAMTPQGAELRSEGKTYTIVLHHGTLPVPLAGRLADAALAAAEGVVPVVEKALGRPKRSLLLHLFFDAREYEAVAARESELPFVVPGFCKYEQGTAYVSMVPALAPADFEVIGLPANMQLAVVEHAAMLAAAERSETAAGDPWLAEVFAAGVVDTLLLADKTSGNPLADARQQAVVAAMRSDKPPKWTSVVAPWPLQPSSFDEWDRRRQERAAMARLLTDTSTAWARKLLSSPLKASARVWDKRFAAVEAVLGTDRKRCEDRFAKLLASLKPQWRVVGPGASLVDGRLQLAGGADAAELRAVAAPPAGPYVVRGRIELGAADELDAMVLLDVNKGDLLACHFRAKGIGCASWDMATQRWTTHETFDKPLPRGKPFAFTIGVSDSIRLWIDGEEVGTVPTHGHSMRGPWGIAAVKGIAWFDQLAAEPTGAPRK